jgi:hypothetical protein
MSGVLGMHCRRSLFFCCSCVKTAGLDDTTSERTIHVAACSAQYQKHISSTSNTLIIVVSCNISSSLPMKELVSFGGTTSRNTALLSPTSTCKLLTLQPCYIYLRI